VIKFLQEHVLPEGVYVVALQALEWLTACIDCGSAGAVTIANSKTDYVFFLESSREILNQLQAKQSSTNKITADKMTLLLPHIVGLFETKTPNSLRSSSEGPVHQAILEYLAVNKMRSETKGGHAKTVRPQNV
jgi:hypothetical protein